MSQISSRLLLLTAVWLAAAPPAQAQYFGQNKVQYRTFDLHILKTSTSTSTTIPRSRRPPGTPLASPSAGTPGCRRSSSTTSLERCAGRRSRLALDARLLLVPLRDVLQVE